VSDGRIVCADNLEVLGGLGDGSVQLIYIDPPFNTGSEQSLGGFAYGDRHDDYLGFLEPRLREAHRVLSDEGTLYVHLDPRESHYVKVLLDGIFGRDCFLNEIVWAYDYGGRPKRRWPAKHDVILVYVRDRAKYWFNDDEVDREPYMAPGLVGPEKAARGKRPSDTWWHTIVPTNGNERTGYPTQKPVGIVRRIVNASSRPGDLCLDFFAGSGTLGAVAQELGRPFLLVDSNPEAITVMEKRLGLAADDYSRPPCSERTQQPSS
jgi:site-specific DNA-methyltransferase (adenine-specific)